MTATDHNQIGTLRAIKSEWLRMVESAVGYAGRLVHWFADKTHITLEIIRRGHTKSFKVLLQRWVVERTFAWIFKNRCLAP